MSPFPLLKPWACLSASTSMLMKPPNAAFDALCRSRSNVTLPSALVSVTRRYQTSCPPCWRISPASTTPSLSLSSHALSHVPTSPSPLATEIDVAPVHPAAQVTAFAGVPVAPAVAAPSGRSTPPVVPKLPSAIAEDESKSTWARTLLPTNPVTVTEVSGCTLTMSPSTYNGVD